MVTFFSFHCCNLPNGLWKGKWKQPKSAEKCDDCFNPYSMIYVFQRQTIAACGTIANICTFVNIHPFVFLQCHCQTTVLSMLTCLLNSTCLLFAALFEPRRNIRFSTTPVPTPATPQQDAPAPSPPAPPCP